VTFYAKLASEARNVDSLEAAIISAIEAQLKFHFGLTLSTRLLNQ